jgi:hypothetical protein
VVDTSVIAPVGGPCELLRPWHDSFESWAAHGISPHVTLLSPFLRAGEISAEVEDRLASVVEASLPLEVVFDRVELLPGATCMLPLDDDALRRVTGDVLRLWPHLRSRLRTGRRRPYHLTVAATDDQGMHDEVRSALDPLLPITMRFASVQVVAHGDDADEVRPLATIRVDAPTERRPGCTHDR